jgi:hypothetical protein
MLETCTWKFAGISYFSDLRQTRCARKIPKPDLKMHLLSKKPRIIWILGNILLYLFGVTQLGHFQYFWMVH